MWHERDRMAQRADKWWRSVWHVQMLMSGRGECEAKPLSKANLLTVDVGRAFLKAKSTKPQTKPNVGRSDNTIGDTR